MANEPKVECYFEGEAFWAQFDAHRAEYAGPGAQLRILKQGNKHFMQFCAGDGDGGELINDSHPCPGSPGC
jgi:hypothetical protein